jgi:MFS family permease
MAQIRSTDWLRHIWMLPAIGAGLTILGIFLPACYSDFTVLKDTWMWFFGFWYSTSEYATQSTGWPNAIYSSPDDAKLITVGVVTVVLLLIALILMATASTTEKQGRRNNVLAGTIIFGGILAIIGPIFYYYYIDAETVHWEIFDPSIGFYLPIIGGIVGIIGGILTGYAYLLERKGPISTYQPQPVEKPTLVTQVTTQIQPEEYKYCPNCGVKLLGPYCHECGNKVY